MGNVETSRRALNQGDHIHNEDTRDGTEECGVCRALAALDGLVRELGTLRRELEGDHACDDDCDVRRAFAALEDLVAELKTLERELDR